MTYTYMVAGLISMSVSTYVLRKICNGSKSKFAYALMAFTFIMGATNLSLFFISKFRFSYIVAGQTRYSENFYAFQTANYCYYLVTLQSWVFGMKYLESSMFSSLTPACITTHSVRIINCTVIIIYVAVMVAMYIWSMVTFPGSVNNDSLD